MNMTKSEILNTMKLLDIKEVTTPRQALNGTRKFKLPMKWYSKYDDRYSYDIILSSYASGYVRKSCWKHIFSGNPAEYQVNKVIRYKEKGNRYYNYKRVLIPNEVDRLEYLLKFAVRNYYTKPQVQVKKEVINIEPEVSVIVNGHRYNL